jgi:hypothetical protein
MSINRSSLPLPLAIFHSHPSKIFSRQLLPPCSTTAAASAQEAGPAAMASPFPSFLAEQRRPSVDEAGAPSSFSTAVGTPTPRSAPHPSHGGRRAPCSSFGERLQQGAFFPSGASALPPQRPFFFHGLQQLDPPLHGASFIFQSRRSSSSWRPHSLLQLLSASSHPPKTASAGAFFPMEAEPPAPSRDAQNFFPAESLFPWAPPPCSFPLPAPRNCSSSSFSPASNPLQVTLCSAPSSQQQAPDFCTPTWGCAVPTQGVAWVLDSPTLRRRSARFDCLRVSLRRICAAPTCHRGNPW